MSDKNENNQKTTCPRCGEVCELSEDDICYNCRCEITEEIEAWYYENGKTYE